jgi:ABC-type Fe3+/spermidine/putrescine transport system ATPase subunit
MHPNGLFVAHFIGESNFLEGYITETDGYSEVELRGGLKVKAKNPGIKQGERIVLAIRPETCEMKKGYGSAENGLFGKIEKVTFEGTLVRYEIRLENGDRLVINRPSLAEEWIDIDQEVTITYPLDKAHLFMYPEAGLTEETSV